MAVHSILCWLILRILFKVLFFLLFTVYQYKVSELGGGGDMRNGRKSDWFHIIEKKRVGDSMKRGRWEKGVQKEGNGIVNRIKRAATYLKWRRRRRTGKVNVSAHGSVMSGLDGPVIVAHWISWRCRRQQRRRRRRRWILAVIRRLMMVIDAAASLQAPQGVQLNYVRTNQIESIYVLTPSQTTD